MRKIHILIMFLLMFGVNLFSEIEYCVSGKVTRDGIGIKGVRVTIRTEYPYFSDYEKFKKKLKNRVRKITETDKNGHFVFYLTKGRYTINLMLSDKYTEYDYSAFGPKKVKVINKNIRNLNYKVLSYREIVEANLDILKGIPLSTPTIKYKYGRIPIFSESECRKKAQEIWIDEKDDNNIPDYLKRAKIREATIYYDFKNNPFFYEYPFVYRGVEVACIGIYAVGKKPEEEFAKFTEIDESMTESEFNKNIEVLKKNKLSPHYKIPTKIKEISEKENCNVEDIIVEKLICTSYGADCLNVLLKIPSKNKQYLVGLILGYSNEDSITNSSVFNHLSEYYEMCITYRYIINFIKN